MRLALVDIDQTLILKDSETLWCRYLTRNGIYDMSRIEGFYRDYIAGQLDFDAFARFQLEPLARLDPELLRQHRARFLEEEIVPTLCETLRRRIADHQGRGDQVLVVSAAHDFLAAPIARMAGIEDGLFTMTEREGRGFTGRVRGLPCFREGKVKHVEAWLAERGLGWSDLEDSAFYSDSHNDLPLLRRVRRPVAVRPDAELLRVAREESWEVIEA